MQIVVILYCLWNDKKEKSVRVQYRCNHSRPNYVAHDSNVTFWREHFNTGLKNVFNLSTDVEPVDIELTVFTYWPECVFCN